MTNNIRHETIIHLFFLKLVMGKLRRIGTQIPLKKD